MKAEQNGTIVNLRAEIPDEQRLLDAYWERGVRVCSGGGRLGISFPVSTYILELNEEQVMALMHLLGSGRNYIPLNIEYQSILEEVMRSMKRRDGGTTMGFPARAFTQPEPAVIAEDRLKQGSHTSVTVSILPDTSGDYVIMGENSEAVLKAVGEYLLAVKDPEEESS